MRPFFFTGLWLFAACTSSAEPFAADIGNSNDVANPDAATDIATDIATTDPFAAPPLPSFELQAGSGETAFEPITAATTLPLIRGSQGLQHVFVSLRAPIPRGFHRVLAAISEPTAPASWLVPPFQQNVPWTAVPGAQDMAEVVGILVVVEDAARATAATSLQLHLRVDTSAGRMGLTTVPIRIAWP